MIWKSFRAFPRLLHKPKLTAQQIFHHKLHPRLFKRKRLGTIERQKDILLLLPSGPIILVIYEVYCLFYSLLID